MAFNIHVPRQVAGQQGAYLAHMINRGYLIGTGGLDRPPPSRPVLNPLAALLAPVSGGGGAVPSPKTSPQSTTAVGEAGPPVVAREPLTSYDEMAITVAASPSAKVELCRRPFGEILMNHYWTP